MYVFMFREDHSHYKWTFAFSDTTAANAANAITDWSAVLGVPSEIMSDDPTQFRNETVRLVSKDIQVPLHFTLRYCP